MHIDRLEAGTFQIVPLEPYKEEHVKEIFDLVKKGDDEQVEDLLTRAYDNSSIFLKTCKCDFDYLE